MSPEAKTNRQTNKKKNPNHCHFPSPSKVDFFLKDRMRESCCDTTPRLRKLPLCVVLSYNGLETYLTGGPVYMLPGELPLSPPKNPVVFLSKLSGPGGSCVPWADLEPIRVCQN